MDKLSRLLLLLGGLLLATFTYAATLEGLFSSDLESGDYDCLLTLEPAATLGTNAVARLSLEVGPGKPYTLLVITKEKIELHSVVSGKRQQIAKMASGVTPGKTFNLTVMRRGKVIGIMRGDILLGYGDVPRSDGSQAGIVTDAGWKVSATRIQRIEPVVFSDDFMRDLNDNSPWTKISGKWHLKSAWDNIPHGLSTATAIMNHSHEPERSQGQNPFAWVGTGDGGKPAVCTTGNAFWEDYTYSVSVNPARDGACGLLCNISTSGSGLLVRWSSANDRKAGGNELTLSSYEVATGKTVELARSPGGYIPGQWYKLSVISSLGSLRVLIDGQERIVQKNANPWRGSVGLYAEGNNGTIFDDVTVYGRMLNLDLLHESKQMQITQRFINDPNGMKEWAIGQGDWVPDQSIAGYRWYRQELYGDHSWITMTINPAINSNGELWMTLNADGKNPNSGYRAVVKLTGTPAKLSYALYRDTTEIVKKNATPLAAGTEYTLHFWHVGNKIWLEVDGEPVIETTDRTPLTGMRPAYRSSGAAFANVSRIQIEGYNTLDYPFTEAPVDWLAHGNWEPSIRWSCTPDWSFLAGWSRGDAVLWQKKRFSGDHSIEAYVGTKMDYTRETDVYYNRQGNFAVSLCSDGKDPRNGYAGIYGYPDDNGAPAARAVILRNGVVKASIPVAKRHWASNHRAWFNLQLNKRGNTITFTSKVAGEVYNLTFTDEQPIDEGIPALWTYDNAMTVARTRIDFATAPVPRTDPQVVIANPWYPEWTNQDVPMTLDLSNSWSATGKPISWKITPANVPANEEGAVVVKDGQLTFTPKKSGKHWYRIAAVDQQNQSEDFHLSLSVFNPALKRDDSHTLVLYRFDEGKGITVRDHSTIGPALNLTLIPDPNYCQWLPGQGVSMRGGVKAFASNGAADKLLAIKKNNACAMECWVSAETLFSNFGRSGCFFSWEPLQAGVQSPIPYLGFCYIQDYPTIATGGLPFQANAQLYSASSFLTSLHHLMVTWDGVTTTFYFDGVKACELKTPWNTDKWTSNAQLYVANQQNDMRPLLGAMYLLAIHDRCFTADEVMRHFKAGPSAK